MYYGQRQVVLLPVASVLDAFNKKEGSLDEIRSFIRSAKGELDSASMTVIQNPGDVLYLPAGLQGFPKNHTSDPLKALRRLAM